MYVFHHALVKFRGSRGRLIERDIREEPIHNVFERYSSVYLVLSHPVLEGEQVLNLMDAQLHLQSADSTTTVAQWLAGIGNTSLPLSTKLPQSVVRTVKYAEAFQAGYRIELIHRMASAETPYPDEELTDLHLTRSNVDYGQFYKHCLVTVNGYVHRTDYNEQGIYVRDGGLNVQHANDHQIGLLSFEEIGELQFIDITEEMIHPNTIGGELKDGICIKLPEAIGNRIPMLVLGGYLHVVDKAYTVRSTDTLKINPTRLSLMHRFFDSRKFLNLDHLLEVIDIGQFNPTHVEVPGMYSDEALKRWLTQSTSFVILVNASNLYVEPHKLEYAYLPGRYIYHRVPEWPLMTDRGRLPAYVAMKEHDRYSIAITDNAINHYRFETSNWRDNISIDGTRDSLKPFTYSPGFLLEIGTEVEE